MKLVHLILLSFSLILVSCKDDNGIRQNRDLTFLLAAFELGIFKPNYCSPPQLLLEEGKTYNITLEAGKRFWYAYSVTPEFQKSSKKMRLTITRTNNETIENINVPCDDSVENGDIRLPSINLPTKLEYEINSIYRFESTGFKVGQILKSETTTIITLKFEIF